MIHEADVGPVKQFRLVRQFWGRDVYQTAAYFLDGVLIDTGFNRIAHKFFDLLRAESAHRIVHTHAHEDHVGANYLFQEHDGLIARAHPEAVDLIQHPPQKLKLYRDFIWGLPKPAEAVPFNADTISSEEYNLQIIETPGHTAGHVCFYEPHEGWLFGGDLFLGVRVKVLRFDECVHDLMNSLRRVLQLPMTMYFCGSGKILSEPNKALGQKLEFMEEVKERVLSLRQRGWELRKIRDHVLGREGMLTLISQGEFSKLNLVKGFLSST